MRRAVLSLPSLSRHHLYQMGASLCTGEKIADEAAMDKSRQIEMELKRERLEG